MNTIINYKNTSSAFRLVENDYCFSKEADWFIRHTMRSGKI